MEKTDKTEQHGSVNMIHYDEKGILRSDLTIPIPGPRTTIESLFKALALKEKDYYVTTKGARPRAGHLVEANQIISIQDVETIYTK
jgi:hypothetical protein